MGKEEEREEKGGENYFSLISLPMTGVVNSH